MSANGQDQPLRGIAYILLSMTAFSVMNVFGKAMTGSYDVLQVVFFRSLFVLVPCAAVILWQKQTAFFTTANPRSHLIRGIVGLACMLCVFYSLKLLPLADAVAIGFLGPTFATVAAMVFLQEKAGWQRWVAILGGLFGVVIMLQPGLTPVNQLGLAVALLGSLLYGVTMVWVRKLGRTEPALTTVWFFALFATVMMALAQPFVWVTPGPGDFAQLTLTGLCAFVGQLYVTKAYQYAPAATISPFNYTTLLWAILFGNLFWHEMPTPQILSGAIIVVLAGSVTAVHEARQSRRAKRQSLPREPGPP